MDSSERVHRVFKACNPQCVQSGYVRSVDIGFLILFGIIRNRCLWEDLILEHLLF